MKLFSIIKDIFQDHDIHISDRMNIVDARLSVPREALPTVNQIQSIFNLVPIRDNISIIFENDSGDLLSFTNKEKIEMDFSEFVDGMCPDDVIDVNITINKSIGDNRFSIYDYGGFSQHLLDTPILDVLKWFSSHLSSLDYIVFEVFDCNVSFSTGSICFTSNENFDFQPRVNRQERLQICKEVSNFYNMGTYELLPDDFAIGEVIEPNNSNVMCFFGKINTLLSLVYVASSASIEGEELNIHMDSWRVISQTIKLDDISVNPKWLFIYQWLFNEGNTTDKALIARNMISLYCKDIDVFDIGDQLLGAIKSNYNLYLKDNVDRYLSLKNEIAGYIQNMLTQVGEYATSISTQFKRNLIAIFGFFFTIVLTGIGRAHSWENLFSRDVIYVIQVVLLGSLVYIVPCVRETCFKLKQMKAAYDKLKKNYESALSAEDIKQSFGNDELLTDAVDTIKKGMWRWTSIWGVLLIVGIIVIEVLTSDGGVFTWLLHRSC